ncbi:hypothetical protein [Actinosynnema sp. NPDC020468]|uniref:hypothetical protein n=1 Tax=Actinosynnema sp. NPDC020468 TaxID=3154488 RepID=UPI0033CFD2E3
MNRIARFVAAAAAGGVLALSGAGLANAETASNDASTQDRAVSQVTQLNDAATRFVVAFDKADVAGVQSALTDLRPVLAELQTNRALSSEASQADALAADLQKALPSLPGLPDLSSLLALLQPATGLVGLVQGLLTSLLGNLPVPLPTSLLTGLLGGLLGGVTGGGSGGGLPGLPSLPGLGGLPGLGALGGLTGGLPLLGGLLGGLGG